MSITKPRLKSLGSLLVCSIVQHILQERYNLGCNNFVAFVIEMAIINIIQRSLRIVPRFQTRCIIQIKEAIHWSSKKENCCNLLWTSGAASRLRALCPDAQWVDISEGWLTDNP